MRAVPATAAPISDVSDVDFTITPSITVTSPNSAVTWAAGSTRTMTWKHNLPAGETVDITFSADGGVTWLVVATAVGNDTPTAGSYTGPMPDVITSNGVIRVSPTLHPADGDDAKNPITLEVPDVRVTAPNTNVKWTVGETKTISWHQNLGDLESVRIELSRDGGLTWEDVAASVTNTGTAAGHFDWVVSGPATAAARIRVTWLGHATVVDVSDRDFRIE